MTTVAKPKTRNQTFECFKLLASVFVVFIHVKFPDRLGELMTCLARFAVPLFFAISGYYSYQTKSSRLAKRIVHILALNLLGSGIYLAWSVFSGFYLGNDVSELFWPKIYHIVRWILMGKDPYGGHLWFLPSLALAYGILWVYTRFYEDDSVNYRPLYTVSSLLMLVLLTCFELFPATEVSVPRVAFRNGFFFALPFLSLGIFLREHTERLFRAFCLTERKLLGIFLGALAFSVLEWYGIGNCEIYLGSMIAVPAVVLLCAGHPTISEGALASRILSRLGSVSTGVYLLHMVVREAYTPFVRWRIAGLLNHTEPYFEPIVVALLSILASVLFVLCRDLAAGIVKKK